MKYIVIFYGLLLFSPGIYSAENGLPTSIDVSRVKKISYLLASHRGIGRSSFGHAYLRFSYDKKGLSSEDITVEFVADSPLNSLNYLRALGIGRNYAMAMKAASYKRVHNYLAIRQDRDLTSYVLKLSSNEIKSLSSKVNERILNGLGLSYNFFLSNCATAVSSIMEEVLDVNFYRPYSLVPTLIPHILKKSSMLSQIHVDPRATVLRKRVIAQKLKGMSLEGTALINIKDQLKSRNFSKRLLALYKIQLYRQEHYDNRLIDRKFGSLGRNILKYESSVVKSHMLPYFSSKKDFFDRVVVDDLVIPLKSLRIKSTKLSIREDRVYIKVRLESHLRHKKNHSSKNFSVLQRLAGFYYEDGVIYGPQGEVFSYRFNKDIVPSGFYYPGVYINSEIIKVKGKKKIHFTVLKEKNFNLRSERFTKQDLLAVDNGNGIKTDGFCYAHSELTQLMKSRTLFDPQAKRLSRQENLQLINQLYQEKIVVIPGFTTTNEFTKSLGRENLGKFLGRRQKNAYRFLDFAKDWFSDIQISHYNFYLLKNLLKIGYYPLIKFRVDGKKNIGHSVIITEMTKSQRGYELSVIDSNNLSPSRDDQHKIIRGIYWFNFKTARLHTFSYGNVKIILPSDDLEKDELINFVMSNQGIKERIIQTSRQTGVYSFHLHELLR